jgi:hypothetical protein
MRSTNIPHIYVTSPKMNVITRTIGSSGNFCECVAPQRIGECGGDKGALWPPKPKELFTVTRTFFSRAARSTMNLVRTGARRGERLYRLQYRLAGVSDPGYNIIRAELHLARACFARGRHRRVERSFEGCDRWSV